MKNLKAVHYFLPKLKQFILKVQEPNLRITFNKIKQKANDVLEENLNSETREKLSSIVMKFSSSSFAREFTKISKRRNFINLITITSNVHVNNANYSAFSLSKLQSRYVVHLKDFEEANTFLSDYRNFINQKYLNKYHGNDLVNEFDELFILRQRERNKLRSNLKQSRYGSIISGNKSYNSCSSSPYKIVNKAKENKKKRNITASMKLNYDYFKFKSIERDMQQNYFKMLKITDRESYMEKIKRKQKEINVSSGDLEKELKRINKIKSISKSKDKGKLML